MCPLGRAGSSPALGTLSDLLSSTRVAKLVDAQSSGGCAFGRAGSSPAPGTKREIAAMRSPVFGFFWSASAAGTNTWRSLLGGDTEVYRAYDNQRFGISVRCVQD